MRILHLLDLDPHDTEAEIQACIAIGGGTPPTAVHDGCRALMLAVFEDGIRSALSPVRQIRQEADIWLECRRARGPFAFTVLCECFGLEPHLVRAAIARMRRGALERLDAPHRRRSRPNVRRGALLAVIRLRRALETPLHTNQHTTVIPAKSRDPGYWSPRPDPTISRVSSSIVSRRRS